MQRDTIFFIAVKDLHVSGGFPARHQELKNCKPSIGYMSSLLAATRCSVCSIDSNKEYCITLHLVGYTHRGADKSLARPTSRCISFDSSLVIYINSTNISPIMIINRIYENQNLLSL